MNTTDSAPLYFDLTQPRKKRPEHVSSQIERLASLCPGESYDHDHSRYAEANTFSKWLAQRRHRDRRAYRAKRLSGESYRIWVEE